ncbi:MAG: radical SAM protein [bacterium]|nr:radical SAM protein [bacterium]
MSQLDIDSTEYLDALSIEMASKCNLDCIMCSHPTSERENTTMSMDDFKTILDKIAPTKIRKLFLNMGEPFVNKAVHRMIAYAKRKGFAVFISTNGQLLTEESMEHLIKNKVDCLKFSIEGCSPQVYKKIRVNGNFDRLFRNVVRLKEKRDRSGSTMSLRISTILMKENANLLEFIKYWGPYCDEIEYCGLSNHIGLSANKEISLSDNWKHRGTCPQIKPFRELNVLANGDLVICCVDFHGKCVLGNLVSQDFADIWNSEKMKEIRTKAYEGNTDQLEPCKDCFLADYSPVYWKKMRFEVDLIHDTIKKKMWDTLTNIRWESGSGKSCPACSEPLNISFAGICVGCLEKKPA